MEIRKNNKINIYAICNWEFITTHLPLPLHGDGSQHRGSNKSDFQTNRQDNIARLILSFQSDKQNSSTESL